MGFYMDNSVNNNIIYDNFNTTTLDNRIENIENNVSSIMQADLFLVAFIVVVVVCFLLYKAVDNFISF